MDTSFIQKLRMNGLFGPGNDNSLGPPDFHAGEIDIDSMLNKALGFRNARNMVDQSWVNPNESVLPNRVGAIGNSLIANPSASTPEMKPMNTAANVSNINPIDSFMTNGHPETAYQQDSLDVARAKVLGTDVNNAGKLNIAQQNADTNKKKADILDFKSKHPELKWEAPAGGNITIFNPLTGERQDTGISSGIMDEEEKQNLIGKQAMDRVVQTGTNQMNLQGKRSEDNLTAIAANIAGRQSLQDSKPVKDELPTQTRARQFNTARQLLSEHPEYAPYIKLGVNNDFEVVPPSPNNYFNKGPDDTTFKTINNAIFGTNPRPTAPVNSSPDNIPATDDAPPAGARPGGKWIQSTFGKVYVEPQGNH